MKHVVHCEHLVVNGLLRCMENAVHVPQWIYVKSLSYFCKFYTYVNPLIAVI